MDTHGRVSVGLQAKTYLYQLCTDTECSLEDLPGVMSDRVRWQKSENSMLSEELYYYYYYYEYYFLL